jgi:hypothetical protein
MKLCTGISLLFRPTRRLSFISRSGFFQHFNTTLLKALYWHTLKASLDVFHDLMWVKFNRPPWREKSTKTIVKQKTKKTAEQMSFGWELKLRKEKF